MDYVNIKIEEQLNNLNLAALPSIYKIKTKSRIKYWVIGSFPFLIDIVIYPLDTKH
jgi:hypothetical protein